MNLRKRQADNGYLDLDPGARGNEYQLAFAMLGQKIVGQSEAIDKVAFAYQLFKSGIYPQGRPIRSMLFLGPTGSGKTKTVEAMTEFLFGDQNALVKIDCAEFQHSHEIAKLIGSPPGYLGHRETHPRLSQEALDQCHKEDLKLTLVLFDEIEKASSAFWDLLLGILDKAALTLGDNRRVDFSRTIIFMTSNLGSKEISSAGKTPLGFSDAPSTGKLDARIERYGKEAAERRFTPEFMNRIDHVVSFRPLGTGELRKILDIELREIEWRSKVVLALSSSAKDFLVKEGSDNKYGARFLRRMLEMHILSALVNLKTTGQILDGDRLRIEYDQVGAKLIFRKANQNAAAAS